MIITIMLIIIKICKLYIVNIIYAGYLRAAVYIVQEKFLIHAVFLARDGLSGLAGKIALLIVNYSLRAIFATEEKRCAFSYLYIFRV